MVNVNLVGPAEAEHLRGGHDPAVAVPRRQAEAEELQQAGVQFNCEKILLENQLEKPLEFWLEIFCTKKKCLKMRSLDVQN